MTIPLIRHDVGLRDELYQEKVAMQVQECTELVVPIIYIQPDYEELKRRFPAYVNPSYKRERLEPVDSCKSVSREDCEVSFEYINMERDALTNEVLRVMDRKGLRPALYEELLGFAEKYPDEQLKYSIIALGSETRGCCPGYVAYLFNVGGGRLDLIWHNFCWYEGYRFLAVRL